MKRLPTIVRRKVREDVQNLLKEAEEKKNENYPNAIEILDEAAQLLPHLAVENTDRRSVKQMTPDRATQELYYMGKRGNILYELKEFVEAQKCYEFVKQKLPNRTEVHKALGDCLRKLKKFPEASIVYDRALVVYEKDDSAAPSIKAGLLNSRGLNYMEQEKYSEAKDDFEAAVKMTTKNPNPLYLCNKGYALYALNEKDEALEVFNEVNELMKSGQTYGLTEQNLEFIRKTFEELVKGLKDFQNVELEKPDAGIHTRELDLIKSGLNALNGEDQGDTTVIEAAGEEQDEAEKRKAFSLRMAAKILALKGIKADVQEIQKDPKLWEYYDGFMFALAQSYKTAVIINSGQVVVSSSSEVEMLTSALKLVPLLGSQLADGVKLASDAKIQKAAASICKFATTEGMFVEIVQDALVELIKLKQRKIKAQKSDYINETILPKWTFNFEEMLKKINKVKDQAEKMLYGERNETPLQKWGCQMASALISDHIASGTIYEGVQYAVRMPREEKKKRLVKIANELFDKSLEKSSLQSESPASKTLPESPEFKNQSVPNWTEVETKKVSGECCVKDSCNMF